MDTDTPTTTSTYRQMTDAEQMARDLVVGYTPENAALHVRDLYGLTDAATLALAERIGADAAVVRQCLTA